MKTKTQPTNVEISVQKNDFLVSKTDKKGRITYANRHFMKIAGYSEQELLGQQHNIVRHPDMPRSVFALLWKTLQSGSEFNGYIKNLRKDGGFYWVLANITPSLSARGEVMGYFSVRRQPHKQALSTISRLYQDMLAAEKKAGTKHAIQASTTLLNERLHETGDGYEKFVLSL